MFWTDKIVGEIKDRFGTDKELTIRDEITMSGRVHVGSMRGVAIHGAVAQVLAEGGIKNTFIYELNDFDPMDDIPSYVDVESYKKHLGKPLHAIPAPEGEGLPASRGQAGSFAEYYAREFQEVIEQAGFRPTYAWTYELYKSGKMNDAIRKALEGADTIREIYKKVSGAERPEGWLPIEIVCEQCGKILTTEAHDFDGGTVAYTCSTKEGVGGAVGCGYEGRISPFDGNGKLPWKVDWPAKWLAHGVDIEGAGKDHTTKGGSRDVGNHIAREIFGITPPIDIPYEFFLVGGKKMSGSKGVGASAADISRLVPTKIFRLVLLGTLPKRAINMDPAGDTLPTWFDWYDKIAEKYWSGEEAKAIAGSSSDASQGEAFRDDDARLFELVHEGSPPERLYLPRFSTVAFLVQMPHLNLEEEIANIKAEYEQRGEASLLTEGERDELAARAQFARTWLGQYAPERYKFEIQEAMPEIALSPEQKGALARVLEYIEQHEELDGQEMHTRLHEIRKETNIEPKEFFAALYLITLGKENGPKVGWFLSVLDRSFLIKRLHEAVA